MEPVFDVDPTNSSVAERWIAAMVEARTLPMALQQSIDANPEHATLPPATTPTLQVHKAEPDLPSLEDRVRGELRQLGVLGEEEVWLDSRGEGRQTPGTRVVTRGGVGVLSVIGTHRRISRIGRMTKFVKNCGRCRSSYCSSPNRTPCAARYISLFLVAVMGVPGPCADKWLSLYVCSCSCAT